MRTIPFGYRIEDGVVVIDEKDGEDVKRIFQLYLEGIPLTGIGPKLGLHLYHQNISHILENPIYVGTEYYPQIVDKSVFDKVQVIRAKSLKRYAKSVRPKEKPKVSLRFKLTPVKEQLSDPFEQAQYVYTVISPKE